MQFSYFPESVLASIMEQLTNRWLELQASKEYSTALTKFDSAARRIITKSCKGLYWYPESKYSRLPY